MSHFPRRELPVCIYLSLSLKSRLSNLDILLFVHLSAYELPRIQLSHPLSLPFCSPFPSFIHPSASLSRTYLTNPSFLLRTRPAQANSPISLIPSPLPLTSTYAHAQPSLTTSSSPRLARRHELPSRRFCIGTDRHTARLRRHMPNDRSISSPDFLSSLLRRRRRSFKHLDPL